MVKAAANVHLPDHRHTVCARELMSMTLMKPAASPVQTYFPCGERHRLNFQQLGI